MEDKEIKKEIRENRIFTVVILCLFFGAFGVIGYFGKHEKIPETRQYFRH